MGINIRIGQPTMVSELAKRKYYIRSIGNMTDITSSIGYGTSKPDISISGQCSKPWNSCYFENIHLVGVNIHITFV